MKLNSVSKHPDVSVLNRQPYLHREDPPTRLRAHRDPRLERESLLPHHDAYSNLALLETDIHGAQQFPVHHTTQDARVERVEHMSYAKSLAS